MNDFVRRMTIGDRAPNFLLDDQDGMRRELYNTDLTGGPIVVLVLGNDAAGEAVLRDFAASTDAFARFGAHLYAVLSSERAEAAALATASKVGFPVLADPEGEVAALYLGASDIDAPALFALDPNQRIVALAGGAENDNGAGFADRALAAFARIAPTGTPRLITAQAPILLIPNVVDDALCDRLLDAWAHGERERNVVNVASGYQSAQAGRAEVKRRDDFVIEGALERELVMTLLPRLAPEIERAFAFDKEWGFEKFRVGCYEAEDAGFFRPHRDNPSAALQHRHFAASINLNDGYEGGYVRFPEHGIDHYAPEKGGVAIFSCGLLHEVVPVTKGRRFTLLTFIITR